VKCGSLSKGGTLPSGEWSLLYVSATNFLFYISVVGYNINSDLNINIDILWFSKFIGSHLSDRDISINFNMVS
jgi:hypothetical protein